MTSYPMSNSVTRYLASAFVVAFAITVPVRAEPQMPEGAPKEPSTTTALRATDFLNSIGIDSTFPDRGQPLPKTIEMIRYAGFRWVRGGIEGLTARGPTTVQTYLDLHRQTSVRFSWGLVSGGTDFKKLVQTAKQLAATDALLAFEGNNEPNNWGVTYQGENGGGRVPSWQAVAKLQRDLYTAVKSDPTLKKYPVWSITEGGAGGQRRIAVPDHTRGRGYFIARGNKIRRLCQRS